MIRLKAKGWILPERRLYDDIRKKAKTVDDSAMPELMDVPYKNVTATALFSVFLGNFGVARFYLNDVRGGLLRLFTVVGIPLVSLLFLLIPVLGIYIYAIVCSVISVISGIWWAVDIVACMDAARENNYWRMITKLNRLNGVGIAIP